MFLKVWKEKLRRNIFTLSWTIFMKDRYNAGQIDVQVFVATKGKQFWWMHQPHCLISLEYKLGASIMIMIHFQWNLTQKGTGLIPWKFSFVRSGKTWLALYLLLLLKLHREVHPVKDPPVMSLIPDQTQQLLCFATRFIHRDCIVRKKKGSRPWSRWKHVRHVDGNWHPDSYSEQN